MEACRQAKRAKKNNTKVNVASTGVVASVVCVFIVFRDPTVNRDCDFLSSNTFNLCAFLFCRFI